MRQFLSQNFPDRKGLIFVTGKDYRYMRQVLRVQPGDMISVRLPDGSLQNTTVAAVLEDQKKITLQICSSSCENAGNQNFALNSNDENQITRGVQTAEINAGIASTEYWLFQFIPKPVKFEQIIRQAVECGVHYIVPVIGTFSQKQSIQALSGLDSIARDSGLANNGAKSSPKSERIERIIKEARQQSGSPVDTKVLPPVSVEAACKLWKESCKNTPDNAAVVLWERSENSMPLHQVLSPKESSKEIKLCAVAAGCEGGISSDEIEIMREYGFVPVHFAVNILRCETAALYGIAAAQSAILENKSWVYRK